MAMAPKGPKGQPKWIKESAAYAFQSEKRQVYRDRFNAGDNVREGETERMYIGVKRDEMKKT